MTVEDKKLIAKFMGLKPILISPNVYGLAKSPWVAVTGDNPEKVMNDFCKSTMYHSSWDWLMPVIQRINSQGYELEGVRRLKYIQIHCGCANLDGAYNEVVSFIKWYKEVKV